MMKFFRYLLMLPFISALTAAQHVRISAPKNGIEHTRHDRWEAPELRESEGGWEPNDTRRPRTGQSGWQFHPSNKWKAPRDAEAERRRDYDRNRRRNGGARLQID